MKGDAEPCVGSFCLFIGTMGIFWFYKNRTILHLIHGDPLGESFYVRFIDFPKYANPIMAGHTCLRQF
jgi:hypothetical protein